MASISLLSANLATAFLESYLYGVFFVLSVTSMYIIVRQQLSIRTWPDTKSGLRTVIASPMFGAAIGLFLSNTAHWILAVIRLFQAFVYFEGGMQPIEFYSDLSQRTYIAQLGALCFCVFFGDATLIYRLWIVWAHNKYVVILPLCSLMGLIVCDIGVTIQTSRFRLGDNVNQVSAADWITPLWAFTISTNVYSTALIGWKVWREYVAVRQFVGGRKLMGALVTLVESAALYTIWNIFYYAAYQCQSELQFVLNQTVPAICGIAFMLINVRVGLERAFSEPTQSLLIGPEMRFTASQRLSQRSLPTQDLQEDRYLHA